MPSSPMDSTDDRPSSGVACHHSPWTAYTVGNVGRGMLSPPLDGTHSQTTSGVAFHHRLWEAYMIERRRAWHANIAFGLYRQSNSVGHGMPSLPLGSTDGRTASGVACYHRLWPAYTVERRGAWHDISALRKDDDCGMMTSPPLDSTHGRQRRAWHGFTTLVQHTRFATSGVA